MRSSRARVSIKGFFAGAGAGIGITSGDDGIIRRCPIGKVLGYWLTEAEASFRALKSELSIRPLFHQLEPRVKAHVIGKSFHPMGVPIHVPRAVSHLLRRNTPVLRVRRQAAYTSVGWASFASPFVRDRIPGS